MASLLGLSCVLGASEEVGSLEEGITVLDETEPAVVAVAELSARDSGTAVIL